jgi:hypothetical protein
MSLRTLSHLSPIKTDTSVSSSSIPKTRDRLDDAAPGGER